MPDYPRLQIAGEAALIVYLADAPGPDVSARIQALGARLRERLGGLVEDLTSLFFLPPSLLLFTLSS